MTDFDSTEQITAWNDQEDRRVTEIIRRHGCFLQAVHGDAKGPPFCYTVGLFGLGHPELIVFGLDHESAGHTLNWFFDRIRRGVDLTPGQIVQAPNGGPRFRWRPSPTPALRCTPPTATIRDRARPPSPPVS